MQIIAALILIAFAIGFLYYAVFGGRRKLPKPMKHYHPARLHDNDH